MKFHLNQALPLAIGWFVVPVPVIGWILGVGLLVLWVMGIINAANGQMKRLPLTGSIELIK